MNRTLTALVAIVLFAAGCASNKPAPVTERAPAPGRPAATTAPSPTVAAKPAPPRPADAPRAETYTVKRGDTLYLIALDNGLDYRELAAWNNVQDVNVIRVGQVLRLTPPGGTPAATGGAVTTPLRSAQGSVESRPLGTTPPARPGADTTKSEPKGVRVPYSDQAMAQMSKPEAVPAPKPAARPAEAPAAEARAPEAVRESEDVEWSWPTTGKVVSAFSETANLKGVGIAGKAGQPVLASAAGRVVYSGSGLRGYGKLIIIKHNQTYLSVYAHNNELLVKEGQSVTRGQKIAEMGNTDADQVKLHFEIRRFGKPVDPLKMLPDRPA